MTQSIVSASATSEGVQVRFADGGQRTVDHLLLGTGYRVDIARYPFLAPALLARVRRVNGYPVLSRGMESSVAGLHFVGAPAAWSFGPIMRFVSGGWYTGRALAWAVSRCPAARPSQRRAYRDGRDERCPVITAPSNVRSGTFHQARPSDRRSGPRRGQPGPGDCPEPGTPRHSGLRHR